MEVLQRIEVDGDGLPNEQWIFVGSSDCDLTDLAATRRFIAHYRPTHVINLAAMVGGLFQNLNNNLQFFLKNMVRFHVHITQFKGLRRKFGIVEITSFPLMLQYAYK